MTKMAKSTREDRILIVQGFFFCSLVLSNLLAIKLVNVGLLYFNAGALCYALCFTCTDIIAEVEGKAAGKRMWLAGIVSYPLVFSMVAIAFLAIPKEMIYRPDGAVGSAVVGLHQVGVLQLYGYIMLGSFLSYSFSQLFDIHFFLHLKRLTSGRALWLRSSLSTIASQLLDTAIFVAVAFYPIFKGDLSQIAIMTFGQLLVKWIIGVSDLAVVHLATKWIGSRD